VARATESADQRRLGDEELSLMVLCCDPALDADARLALTLKTVCGFRVEEIARAFLATPEAIAQRLVRAKARVRALGLEFAMPAGAGLAARMPSVCARSISCSTKAILRATAIV
jgi:RNA polymerase sigma-70 factor (ECF subfamily)